MNYYDEISESYNELHSEEQIKKHELVKALGIIDIDESILDIAHGIGIIANTFTQNVITGIDNSSQLLNLSNCSTILHDMNVLPLPFDDKSYDHCTCISAIHHSNDIYNLALEMKRIAKNSVVISILKKSLRYKEMKSELFNALNKPSLEEDAMQDTILVWLI